MHWYLPALLLGLVATPGPCHGGASGDEKTKALARATELTQEGIKLYGQGQTRPALDKLQEALALRRQHLPKDHPGVASSMNNLALVYHRLGRLKEAVALHEEALALRRRVLPKDHPEIATSLSNLAVACSELGQPGKARDLLEEGLAVRRRTMPKDDPRIASGLNNLTSVYLTLGQPDKAKPCAEEALAIRRRALPEGNLDIAKSLNVLTLVHNALGRPDQAKPFVEEALAIQRRALPKGHPDIAISLNHLARIEVNQGRPDRARALLEEAIPTLRRPPPHGHRFLATCLGNLALAHKALGQLDRARELYEEALALQRQTLPKDHRDIAVGLNNLATVYYGLGRLKEAVALHEEALALRRRVLPPGHPLVASSLNNLGLTHYALGRPGESVPLYEEALEVQRRALPKDHPHIAKTLHNLAEVILALGQAEKARALLEEALALHRRALPADDRRIALTLHHLARAHLALGQPEQAWRHALAASRAEASSLLTVLAGSPHSDHAALAADRRHLDLLLRLAGREMEPSAAHAREAVAEVAAQQALSGLNLALRHEAALLGADATAGPTYARLKGVRQRLADLLLRGAGATNPAGYRKQCDELRGELDRLERDLTAVVGGYVPLARAARPDPDRLAEALAPGEVFLNLMQYRGAADRGKRPPRLYGALLLWRDGAGAPQARFLALGPAGPIDAAVREWRAAVQRGGLADGPERVLRQRLWGPLTQLLPKQINRLAVCPEGQLALLPLAALRDAGGKYLLESWSIRHVGAARDLLPVPALPTAQGPAVVLSDPAYDAAAGPARKGERLPAPPGALPPFKRLPGFAREARNAAALLRQQPGWQLDARAGEGATEEALAGVRRPRLLYLITHGFFLEDTRAAAPPGSRDLDFAEPGPRVRRLAPAADPRLRSGLALAGANKAPERSAQGQSDGLLTALEVENLDLLGTELVVLSACETGLGEIQVGEGVLGLRRAFQLAGAQTVVASLWRVPDAQTEQLMSDFLRRWLKGEGKAAALRQAQLELIRQLRQSADPALRDAPPLYWAGFVCHGRPD